MAKLAAIIQPCRVLGVSVNWIGCRDNRSVCEAYRHYCIEVLREADCWRSAKYFLDRPHHIRATVVVSAAVRTTPATV